MLFDQQIYNEILRKIEVAYNKAKPKISKGFIQVFEKENRFHDMNLASYKMYTVKKNSKYAINIEIQIFFSTNYRGNYKLTYEEVDSCIYKHCPEAVSDKHCISLDNSIGEWMYSEIYKEGKFIVHNGMLAGGAEINIKCKDISVVEM